MIDSNNVFRKKAATITNKAIVYDSIRYIIDQGLKMLKPYNLRPLKMHVCTSKQCV